MHKLQASLPLHVTNKSARVCHTSHYNNINKYIFTGFNQHLSNLFLPSKLDENVFDRVQEMIFNYKSYSNLLLHLLIYSLNVRNKSIFIKGQNCSSQCLEFKFSIILCLQTMSSPENSFMNSFLFVGRRERISITDRKLHLFMFLTHSYYYSTLLFSIVVGMVVEGMAERHRDPETGWVRIRVGIGCPVAVEYFSDGRKFP